MTSNKLGRSRRLRDRRAMELTLRAGTVVRTPYFRMCYRRGVGPPGVAFLAGSRVGGAVDRNRARRVLREAFRVSRQDVAELQTLVFVATERAAKARFADLKDALDAALRRASDDAS